MTALPDSRPIIAIATAPGRGGIGVIRISGTNLKPLIQRLFGQPFAQQIKPRLAYFRAFNDDNGQPLDEGIVLFFAAPHSYTGQDVLELQGHGGTAVLRRVLAHCLQAGQDLELRLAQPGEFTQRAFLNRRLDLAQAEAVADLINASSEAAAQAAMQSLTGVFSQHIHALDEDIVNLRMLVEATLDFPEEEIDFLEKYQTRERLNSICARLTALLKDARQGQILREGLHVVLAGQPNVGKSSLLNALAGVEAAIVTPIAGTTRDKITQHIHVDGVPLHITDTAGLRDTTDDVESLGIARTWEQIENAHVIIHLQDARQPDDPLDHAITARLPARTPVLTVRNKVDLLESETPVIHQQDPESTGSAALGPTTQPLYLSARTGQGLDTLKRALLHMAGWQPEQSSPWLARERHLSALQQANAHLTQASEHARHNDAVLDLLAEELRLAHESLCQITGEFTSDDLLGEIFAGFCIGK